MPPLVRPAIWLMSQLTFPRKLAVVAALSLIPLLVIATLLLRRIDAQIAVAERELAGLEAIAPAKALTARIQAHRGAAQLWLSGNTGARLEMEKLEKFARAEIERLDAFDRRHGGRLGTGERWRQVRDAWQELAPPAGGQSAEAAFARHTELVAALNGFLYEVADAARLTLESEPAPYYATMVAAAQLPDLIEKLGQMRALSARVAQRKAIGAEDRFRISALIGASLMAEEVLLAQVRRASEAVPPLKGSLDVPLRAAVEAIRAFMHDVREGIVLPAAVEVEGLAIYDAGTRAIDAAYRLDGVILPVLESLVSERTRRLEGERRHILALIAVVMALGGYLFLGFTLGLLRNLELLRQAAARVAAGDFDAQARLECRDELASIGGSFNRMAGSLRDMVGRLRDSEEKYHRIMEQAGDIILLSARDGTLLDANLMAERLLGYSRDELLGMNLFAITRGRGGERCDQACMFGGEPCDEEHILLCRDGRDIPVHARCAQIDYGSGQAMLSIFRDISGLKEAQRRIEHLASHDALTGLANRTRFYERVELAIARGGEPFALMFIDLDNFKPINDTFGHDLGDRLLQEVARRLEACVGDRDTAARLGGDEFILLLAGAGSERAATVGGSVLEALGTTLLPEAILVTASIGASLFPQDGGDRHTLMKRADAAMYEAKQAGKNALRFHSASTPASGRR